MAHRDDDFAALAEQAKLLRSLHAGAAPLVLPNAWDAASARLVAEAGFPVVATTSSGVSAALGWSDGEGTPEDEMFDAIKRISRSVTVPVTSDIESGYGLTPTELVQRLLAAGSVGCNLEDSNHREPGTLVETAAQVGRLAGVRAAAHSSGVDLVVNARVDIFVRHIGQPEERVRLALERGREYLAAGADCVYPIGRLTEQEIAALASGMGGPINVMAVPDGPSLQRLRELGVRRVSFAGGLYRATAELLKSRLAAIHAELGVG